MKKNSHFWPRRKGQNRFRLPSELGMKYLMIFTIYEILPNGLSKAVEDKKFD